MWIGLKMIGSPRRSGSKARPAIGTWTATIKLIAFRRWGALQGALAFAMAAFMLVFGLKNGMPDDEVRALTFVALVLGIFSLILVNRSFSSSLRLAVVRPNLTLLSILVGAGAILGACLTIPTLRELFRFGPLHVADLALTAGSMLLLLVVLELLKPLWRIQRN